jgi:antitoxin YefM
LAVAHGQPVADPHRWFQVGVLRGVVLSYKKWYNSTMPRITNYSDARAHLKAYCDEVAESGEPLIIRRRGRGDVALVSLDELEGLEETAHLLRSPKSARRLFESIEEVRSGGGVRRTPEALAKKLGLDG